MRQPLFSVVVPTRRNPSVLYLVLQAILRTSPPETEVLVVPDHIDGGEPDAATIGLVQGFSQRNGSPITVQIVEWTGETWGFQAAANAGLVEAKGKYLVVLHDDAHPTKGWLEGMRAALLAAQSSVPDVKWGYVGPMSNFAMPRQSLAVQVPISSDPSRCEATATLLRTQGTEEFYPSGPLDSFCLLMTRQAYEKVGGFDLRFAPGGFEDVDLTLRAQQSGYMAIRAPRVFVFHAGRTTLKEVGLAEHGDIPHQQTLMEKWFPDPAIEHRESALCFMLRIHLRTEVQQQRFVEQIRQLAQLGEMAVVLDDRSIWPPIEALKEAGLRDFVVAYRKNPEHLTPNVKRDRNLLIQMGAETRANWLMGIEPNHFFDPKVDRRRLQALMLPVDPTIQAYQYPVRTFWKDRDTLRVDKEWGSRTATALFRNLNWGGMLELNEIPQDTLPTCLPVEQVSFTSKIVLQDTTYLDLAEAEADGYQINALPHLCIPYVAPRLTYLLMVKNEMAEMPRQLCQARHWADEMIVVDNGSIDGVEDLCRRFDVPYRQFLCCEQSLDPKHMVCDFGKARNYGVDQCQEGYILAMDADEELAPPSYPIVSQFLQEQSDGYLCDIENHQLHPTTGEHQVYMTLQARLFKKHPLLRYEPEVHETLEHAFKRHKGTLNLLKAEITILHHGYIREKPEERAWKGQQYAKKLLEIIKRDPSDARSVYALAQHLNSEKNYDEGDHLLGKALALDPDFLTARIDLGLRLTRRAYELFGTTPLRSIGTDDKKQMIQAITRDLGKWVATLT